MHGPWLLWIAIAESLNAAFDIEDILVPVAHFSRQQFRRSRRALWEWRQVNDDLLEWSEADRKVPRFRWQLTCRHSHRASDVRQHLRRVELSPERLGIRSEPVESVDQLLSG